MRESKYAEELVPGDVFVWEGLQFVCLSVISGPQDATNVHAMRIDDYKQGVTNRDYRFAFSIPCRMTVTAKLDREHTIIRVN